MKKGRRPRRRPRLKLSDKAGPDQCPVPGENALFPAQIAGFLAVSRPVPVYPVFLKYVVSVHLTFSAELESVDCTSNEELLRQVWINLLNNAIRYIPPGGEIGVELRQVGGEAVVRVWDTGSGMTPEVQSHIFEKYYQGAAEDKKHGLGLGLSIVHRIIELTEGRIEVDSQPQQGSSFTVYLPLNQKGA